MFLLVPFFIIADLLSLLVGVFLVNWWAPLFAYHGSVNDGAVTKIGYRLPDWLAWFDTFDGTLDDGLLPGETSCYWTRMRWLYRNPAYGFGYWVLGAEFDPAKWKVETLEIVDGKVRTFYATGPNGRFNWYAERFGIRWKIGPKAWNYYDSSTGRWKEFCWGPVWRAPFAFSISLAK